MKTYYQSYCDTICNLLNSAIATAHGKPIPIDKALTLWIKKIQALRKRGGILYFIGNGGSAMMASHMATDACKMGGIKTMAFNDPSMLTAVSNDECYERSFALPLSRFAKKGEILVAVSSSGNSKNILRAIAQARKMGLFSVTLSGMSKQNRLRKRGDLNFYVPGKTYGHVETCHQVLLHCWFDMFYHQRLPINIR